MTERDPERLQELADLRAVMETPHGRRLLARLMSRTGMFESPLGPGPLLDMYGKDAVLMRAYRQDYGKFLYDEITGCASDLYDTMMVEDRIRRGRVKETKDA